MPDFDTARRLAGALNVPVSYLYEPDDDLATLIRAAGRLPRDRLHTLMKEAERDN